LKELINTKLGCYKNDKGGDFHGERWSSVFLTDSQVNIPINLKLLASLFFNYLDEIYKENGLTRQFLISWPAEPSKISLKLSN
jgi:hypothetical protein